MSENTTPLKLSVIGCGYLGAVHAASMAELGHEVVGIEVDVAKAEALAAGRVPFFEPGFEELLRRSLDSGRLSFSSDMADARGAAVHFVCVGTPQRRGEYAADLTYVEAATASLIEVLGPGELVVGKSTVPVGTAARLAEQVAARVPGAALAWNPEFLREGYAVQDTLHPDRLVYGVPSLSGADTAVDAEKVLDTVYARIVADGTPKVVTDYATAEMVKTAANSFLATKISFINAMAELCEATGADVKQLADAIGHDDRIGRKFLNAGLGFGGGCLPKDIRAFMARAGELGADQALTFLREVDNINMRRRIRMVELARQVCDDSLLRRHPRLPGAERGRAAATAGRERPGDRPAGVAQRAAALVAAGLRRHPGGGRRGRRRRPAADRVEAVPRARPGLVREGRADPPRARRPQRPRPGDLGVRGLDLPRAGQAQRLRPARSVTAPPLR